MDQFTMTTNGNDERCIRVSELMEYLRKFKIPEGESMYYTDGDFGRFHLATSISEKMGETL